MQKPVCLLRRVRYCVDNARAHIVNCRDRLLDPGAGSFFRTLVEHGYRPNAHIDVLPQHRLIYVCVPKSASTSVKALLATLNGRRSVATRKLHNRRHTGLQPPARIGISSFYRLATAPDTLRFTFVRNPYARLVSAWADKFQNKPLVPGDAFIESYLAWRDEADPSLPIGAEATLSFADFVHFAAATAERRVDAHWQLQDDLISMPGIALDFVGRAERFHVDVERVLDHVGAAPTRPAVLRHFNVSKHEPWTNYYTRELADRVYRAYERDFDRLGYARAITPATAVSRLGAQPA